MKNIKTKDFLFNMILNEVYSVKEKLEAIVYENEEIIETSEKIKDSAIQGLNNIDNLSKILPNNEILKELNN